jgi:uncharacterized protein (TIGR03085 family)
VAPTGPGAAAELERERRALVADLRTVGPDAPTLIGGWTARDLAAHLASTEQLRGVPTFTGRWVSVRSGLRLNDLLRPAMAVDLRRFRRHGFDWALGRLERAVPGLLVRPSVLPVTVFEVFVHHEDVRRANRMGPRDPAPLDLVPSIRWLLHYHRRRLGARGVRVELPCGRGVRAGGNGAPATVRGEPGEVLLWLSGRRDAAAVELDTRGAAVDLPALRV